MSSKAPARAARPPGKDWQDSFFSLDERYRQLQKRYNEMEQELKRVTVARRRGEAVPAGPSLSSVPSRRPSLRPTTVSYNRGSNAERRSRTPSFYQDSPLAPEPGTRASLQNTPSSFSPQRRAAFDHVTSDALPSSIGLDNPPYSTSFSTPPPPPTAQSAFPASFSYITPSSEPQHDLGRTQEYVAVPSAAEPQAARAAAITEARAWGDAAALPDPAMVWGTDGQSSMQNYVVASALYHANEELRRKLNESSTTLQTLQQELASTRAQHAAVQTRLDSTAQQMHQLVRERDLAVQKFTNASYTITDMERTLRDRVAEEEKIRFSMESQITELRSRLVVGADSNELLQKDVRSLLAETRDRTGEVMQLRSKLALAESALSSQRNVNENMLVELKSLNAQLVEERKRLITVTREAQIASLSGTRIADLQAQLQRVQAERDTMEQEHVGLMGEFVRVTEDALRHAREEVRLDVADWKAAAEHWEHVSQLLYKDIAERTQQHLQCRAECEEAKEQRDTTALQAKTLKDEVALLSAKLELVWPSHLSDTKDLSVEEIKNVFGQKDRQGIFLFDERRRKSAAAAAARRRRERAAAATETAASGTVESEPSAGDEAGIEGDEEEEDASFQLTAHALSDFPADSTTAAAQLQELHEVNATLLSELHQVRLTNDLLQDRLDALTGKQKDERARVAAAEASLQQREKTGHRLLEKQLDRVAFLEAQVKSLRGYHVAPNMPIDQLGDNENIFELFLGQLVAAEVPEGVEVPDLFAHVFCSVDFLLHETITTPTVRGLNGFFDVTASFCVSMDTLLLYYLHTRQLLVQLHRVRSEGEAAAASAIVASTQTAETSPQVVQTSGGHQREMGQDAVGDGDGRGNSLGGGSVVTTSSSSTHPSLRIAEKMYETIAEGQADLVDIVAAEELRHAARPTMRGHVRLYTPDRRHIASLEFRLTARRPYSPEFLRVLDEAAPMWSATAAAPAAAATVAGGSGQTVAQDSTGACLLDWMRTTANTAADNADLQPMSDPLQPMRGDRFGVVAGDPAGHSTQRRLKAASSPLPQSSAVPPSRLQRSHMQLVPVTDADDATSSSSSFHVQQRAHLVETSGALVVHLPAPSPPPSHLSRNASPWPARPPSSAGWDGDDSSGRTGAPRPTRSAAPLQPGEHESTLLSERPPSSTSFIHVDRSLLTQPVPPRGHGGSGAPAAAVTCLWVDVERLELPADLPLPVPRLSCYFRVAPLHREVWLAAPPTARYTWPYTANSQDGSAAGAFGTPLPVQSVTELAAAIREPLVLFFLDADAMAAQPPTSAAGTAAAAVPAGHACVWAMAVCEWGQVLQHPGTPHAFHLPLLRCDQSVVTGAVVRLSLAATTATTAPMSNMFATASTATTQERQVLPAAPVAQPNNAPAPLGGHAGGTGDGAVNSNVVVPPPILGSRLPCAYSSPQPPLPPAAGVSPLPGGASMEEELLRLEYDQRVSRNAS